MDFRSRENSRVNSFFINCRITCRKQRENLRLLPPSRIHRSEQPSSGNEAWLRLQLLLPLSCILESRAYSLHPRAPALNPILNSSLSPVGNNPKHCVRSDSPPHPARIAKCQPTLPPIIHSHNEVSTDGCLHLNLRSKLFPLPMGGFHLSPRSAREADNLSTTFSYHIP